MTRDLIKLFERDLQALVREIEAYSSEDALWLASGEIKNSAGNLALHLIGNLKHFIGVKLGNSDYQRDREADFAKKNIPRAQIIADLHETNAMIARVLGGLESAKLSETYPQEVLGYPMTTGFFLVHLHGHLNYHLGQVNYHRRLIGGA
jgi:uncharacterized damage-inducible protein DinB